jgi:pimeloyl-ACP methyl ester carboxylesterase
MQIEEVTFYSDGIKLAGWLKKPDSISGGPPPVLVEGPGWLAVASNALSALYHEGFVKAGYAFFVFDNRGFGKSGGEPGWVRPPDQIADLLNAVTYLETRDDVEARRLGLFGFGGTGGGNAIYAAAQDERIKAVCTMTVVADGRDWFHRMRREHEWVDFIQRVERNRRRRVLENIDELVDPREELMVAMPERKAAGMPTDGSDFHLSTAESLLQFRPLDVVGRISPRALLLSCVENDVVTPEDHAVALYERAGAPKKLIRQTGVTHYESYRKNYDLLLEQFVDWYDRYLRYSPVSARSQVPTEEIVYL